MSPAHRALRPSWGAQSSWGLAATRTDGRVSDAFAQGSGPCGFRVSVTQSLAILFVPFFLFFPYFFFLVVLDLNSEPRAPPTSLLQFDSCRISGFSPLWPRPLPAEQLGLQACTSHACPESIFRSWIWFRSTHDVLCVFLGCSDTAASGRPRTLSWSPNGHVGNEQVQHLSPSSLPRCSETHEAAEWPPGP